MYSITTGAEIYILKKLQPLIKDCEFSFLNTIKSTEKFKIIAPKYTRFHEAASFNATSLFTSVNVPRVVDFILTKIYERPEQFFNESDNEIVPPIMFFKEFLSGVLLKFSAFWTLNGFYRQIEGLSFGSKLSPALSNIFLDMMETTVIKPFLDQKILLFYCRYVNDCLLLVRKRYKNVIL